jgi:hypothetical protein
VSAVDDTPAAIGTMSLLTNVITFALISLTVSAKPSQRQKALLMSEQLREAAIKNRMKFDEVQNFRRMDKNVSNATVSNAVATQATATSYFASSLYSDAACSAFTSATLIPLDVCITATLTVYSYSSADKSLTVKYYDSNKCTGTPTSTTAKYADLSEECIGSGNTYFKYSFIPTINALNIAGVLVM